MTPFSPMLKLNPPRDKKQMGKLHGDGPLLAVQRADLQISSLDDSFSFTAYEVPVLTSFNLHPGYVDWPNEITKYPHLADLNLPPVDFSKMTVLLSSAYQEALEPLQIRKSTRESIIRAVGDQDRVWMVRSWPPLYGSWSTFTTLHQSHPESTETQSKRDGSPVMVDRILRYAPGREGANQ